MRVMMSDGTGRETGHVVSTFGALARDQRAAVAEGGDMRAMMSQAGRRALETVSSGNSIDQSKAVAEARRVLAAADREAAAHNITGQGWACDPHTRADVYAVRVALADALAAFVADGGPCDRLAVL